MKRLSHLKESTNAGWNASIPFAGPRPQPDFSVGFGRDAFSEDQLKKLNFDLYGKTYFTGTWQIYFPFLTSEVNQGLDIADRQNAHSMTLAVRGVIDLYQKVKRAPELHRKVLAFSISHDQHSVRIHSHYAEIDGSAIKYYRHRLKEIMILGDDGKDRWTAYQFVRNVYGSFAPVHLRRIKGAIDQLPDPTLELFQPIQRAEGAESSREMTVTSAALSQTTAATPTRGVAAELRKQLEQQRQEAEQERQESEQRFEERLRREKQESEERFKQRHEELMEQNTKLMDLLAQRLT
ncbi:MAG: hypothetical protein M1817_001383 [Caeruleum heppii]|nr:MAG: hypothetical protein M1817_001383 [Caeruleum heppii]